MKMYCVFALEAIKKMNGVRGKMATQAGHAYLCAYWDAEARFPQDVQRYKNSAHAYKITLIVNTVEDLKILQNTYKDVCGNHLVTDAGFTVFKEPITTCLGLGPISESLIGEDLKVLKTFC